MTEKRFYMEDNGIWDNTWKRRKPLTWKELCDMLNKFQELSIEDLELIEQLKKENEELKQKVDFYKDFQKDARELAKENEQLKSEINMLKTTIGRNESYIERLTHKSEWHN